MPSIEAQQQYCRDCKSDAETWHGEMFPGGVPKTVTGDFKKHYSYDQFDEVYIETFERGAVLYVAGKGDEWFPKCIQHWAFEKAKLLGARSKALNRMMR